jgi:hypothetical protein
MAVSRLMSGLTYHPFHSSRLSSSEIQEISPWIRVILGVEKDFFLGTYIPQKSAMNLPQDWSSLDERKQVTYIG